VAGGDQLAPQRVREKRVALARKVLGWPKRCKLAHAFLWEYSCKRLKMAQLLGRHGVFRTCGSGRSPCAASSPCRASTLQPPRA
jgi:hypothetical protein